MVKYLITVRLVIMVGQKCPKALTSYVNALLVESYRGVVPGGARGDMAFGQIS